VDAVRRRRQRDVGAAVDQHPRGRVSHRAEHARDEREQIAIRESRFSNLDEIDAAFRRTAGGLDNTIQARRSSQRRVAAPIRDQLEDRSRGGGDGPSHEPCGGAAGSSR
jgi:hypothetical protein